MTVNKRRKFSRMRGTHTHGWGAKKKHRGAGNRGGRGMAGTGKRADQKKPSILKEFGNDYYGKKGFHRPQKILIKINTINLDDLEAQLEKFMNKKLITKEKDGYIIDLEKLGYQKLLGGGYIKTKLKIKTMFASVKAIDKVQKNGGSVEVKKINIEEVAEEKKLD